MKNGNKKLEILIVDDDEKHLADAQAEINKRIISGAAINVTYAKNYSESSTQMSERRFDGIISDIFFPSGVEDDEFLREQLYILLQEHIESQAEFHGYFACFADTEEKREEQVVLLRKLRDSTIEWVCGRSLAPYGLLVAQIAHETKIPVVLCTSGHHHGSKIAPVAEAVKKYRVYVIDRIINDEKDYLNFEKESEKNWTKAIEELLNPPLRL
ncbi:hypothetical protein J4471_02940 [Candidatus Woesearchaeota archaeon]|nr:hypothetical protein [Candidatus Woesearchaeota archaeon]